MIARIVTRFVLALVVIVSFVPAAVSGQTRAADQTTSLAQSQTPEPPPPPPAHTGWATLVRDTGRDFVVFPKRKSTWTILGIGAAAALVTYPADDHVEQHIVGNEGATNIFKLGKWIGSTEVQLGTALGLWAIGRYVIAPATDGPRTNKFSHLGFDLLRAHVVSQAIVQGMKQTIRRDRPTGECCAFPSGHAAAAFASAAVLERHLGYRASWPAMVIATYVATSRLIDNRHYLSDIMFGAAVGTAAGWTVVGRHGREQYALVPAPVRRGMMIALTRVAD